MERRATIHPD
jgi:hypothetical protein